MSETTSGGLGREDPSETKLSYTYDQWQSDFCFIGPITSCSTASRQIRYSDDGFTVGESWEKSDTVVTGDLEKKASWWIASNEIQNF